MVYLNTFGSFSEENDGKSSVQGASGIAKIFEHMFEPEMLRWAMDVFFLHTTHTYIYIFIQYVYIYIYNIIVE